MTNILQAKGLTVISNEDYSTLKRWQNVFNDEFNLIDFSAGDETLKLMPQEKVYRLGANNMLDDVLGFIEWPDDNTIKAFKKLTAPSINVKTIAIGATLAGAWWITPRMINHMRHGQQKYMQMARVGREGWKGLFNG